MNKYFIIRNWRSVTVNALFLLFIPYCLVFTGCLSPYSQADPPEMMELPEFTSPNHSSNEGFFKYTIPDSMEVGILKKFKFEISDSSFISDEIQLGNDNLIDSTGTLPISNFMKVTLETSDSSTINAVSSPKQAILMRGKDNPSIWYHPTIWEWEVTPLNSGSHTFTFRVIKYQWDSLAKEYMPYDFAVNDIKVDVNVKSENPNILKKVSPPEKKSNNKGFLWLISIPILGLLIWFASRKRKQQKQQLIPLVEFNAFKSNFQQLIARDNIEKAFAALEHLLKKYKDPKLENELVLLKSNYQNNISRNNNNLIGNDEFNLNRSKVINELIAMIDRLKKKHPKPQ